MATINDVSADVEIDPRDVMRNFSNREKIDLYNRLVDAGYGDNNGGDNDSETPPFPVNTLDDEFKMEILSEAFHKYPSWELEKRLK